MLSRILGHPLPRCSLPASIRWSSRFASIRRSNRRHRKTCRNWDRRSVSREARHRTMSHHHNPSKDTSCRCCRTSSSERRPRAHSLPSRSRTTTRTPRLCRMPFRISCARRASNRMSHSCWGSSGRASRMQRCKGRTRCKSASGPCPWR